MRVRSHLTPLLLSICLCIASCKNPYEDFKVQSPLTDEELDMGVSFDFQMDALTVYTTSLAARLDIGDGSKSELNLRLNIISPAYESYEETVSLPIVTSQNQIGYNPSRLGIKLRRSGHLIDQQWGWRKNVRCDTLPGRWRVIVYPADSTDRKMVKALGFTYSGEKEK